MIGVGKGAAKVGGKVATKLGKKFKTAAKAEPRKLRKVAQAAVDYAIKTPIDTLRYLVTLIPRFLTLILRLCKAKETDAKFKLVLAGAIVVISILLGVQISGISRWWWLGVFAALFGPISGILAAVAAETINAALVIIVMVVTFALCLEAVGSDAVKELSVEMFGESEGKSFFEILETTHKKMATLVSPLLRPLRAFFAFVGRRYHRQKDKASLEAASEKAAAAAMDLAKEMKGEKHQKAKPDVGVPVANV